MPRTVVLNVVGLTPRLLARMPSLAGWAASARTAGIVPAFPAVTCTAQSNYLTGRYPADHGVVANGWYAREECEIRFWKQANTIVQAPKIWHALREREPSATVANLFWWFNMYAAVDYGVTPRPMYPADGRKVPDVYTSPAGLRDDLQRALGVFPLFEFWGPRASIRSSQWIADAAKIVEARFSPTLTLIYLPHLDYNLQRLGGTGPDIQADLLAIDALAFDLVRYYEAQGARVIVLSEYGLCDVSHPVHPNRILRQHGLIAVREELGRDVLDPGASAAFAVADHQIAHVYVNDRASLDRVRTLLEADPGVDRVLDDGGKAEHRLDHPRAGDLVAIARPDAWFTYYYWRDDDRAPDYARTVDIHRKPGYDPVELFLDPAMAMPRAQVGWKLAKRMMGFRTLLDVIPLDASLVKGSHGRSDGPPEDGPLCISRSANLFDGDRLASVDVYDLVLRHTLER